jgi:hypothetical protein
VVGLLSISATFLSKINLIKFGYHQLTAAGMVRGFYDIYEFKIQPTNSKKTYGRLRV